LPSDSGALCVHLMMIARCPLKLPDFSTSRYPSQSRLIHVLQLQIFSPCKQIASRAKRCLTFTYCSPMTTTTMCLALGHSVTAYRRSARSWKAPGCDRARMQNTQAGATATTIRKIHPADGRHSLSHSRQITTPAHSGRGHCQCIISAFWGTRVLHGW
jgi:hypothetical protein